MDIRNFNAANNENMAKRILTLREEKEWSASKFNTPKEIADELMRLNDKLNAKNMPEDYYKNIQKHIEDLKVKQEHPIDESKKVDEKAIISDGEFIKAMDNIDKSAKSLKEAYDAKVKYISGVETDILSEDVLRYGLNEDTLPENPEYGVPEEKKYPLYDKHHVESAIRLFGHVNPKYEEHLAHAIISRMRKYGISFDMVGKDNKLYKYLPQSELEENFKQAYRHGNEDEKAKQDKYIQGQAIARIKNPAARAAAVASIKAGRPDVTEKFVGERHTKDAAEAFDKRATKKLNKEMAADKLDSDGNLKESGFNQAYRDGGKKAEDYIQGKAIARIRDKNSRDAAVAAVKANRPDVVKSFIGNRHYEHADSAYIDRSAKKAAAQEKNLKEESDITSVLNAIRSDYQGELKAIKDYDVHADDCEKNGYTDAAKVLRDIRDEEKVHLGELQKVLSKYDSEYDASVKDGHEEASEKLSESVLDPVHKERCPELWENNKLKPEIKQFIFSTLEEFKKQLNFELKITNIYIIGSSTSYQYTDTSDIDVTVRIPEAFSDEDYEALKKVIPNGHNVPGTQHPVNYFFTADFQEKNAENIYDLATDTWLKDTPKEESELPTGYILQLSKFFMNSLDLTFSDYARDTQEYFEYKAMDPNVVEISEKERQEAMDRQMTKIKADLDSLRIGNHVIRGFMHEAYNSDDDQYTIHIEIDNPNKDPRKSINNLVYKCLEKFGYRTKLDETIAKAEEFIENESPSGKQLTEEETVNVRGSLPSKDSQIERGFALTKSQRFDKDYMIAKGSKMVSNTLTPLILALINPLLFGVPGLIATLVMHNNNTERLTSDNYKQIKKVAENDPKCSKLLKDIAKELSSTNPNGKRLKYMRTEFYAALRDARNKAALTETCISAETLESIIIEQCNNADEYTDDDNFCLNLLYEASEKTDATEEFTPTSDKSLEVLKDAVYEMSRIKRGALIAILGKDNIFKNGSVIQDGTDIDWNIDKKKILDMFIVGTPLHDGAAIIKGDKMIKGAVFVEPTLTKMSGKFGARHQATKGITENSDAIAIIVSEETGDVSVAFDGELVPATEDKFISLIKNDFEKISRNSGKGYVVVRKLITDGKNAKINGVIHDKKDGDVIEGKDAEIKGKVKIEPNKGNPLTESVTFIDNAGNLKTMSAENYNKDMHEYHTNYQIKKFKLKKSKTYKLRDDKKED